MFSIYHQDVLIGRSRLESGDPPMGVASGVLQPTEAFAALSQAFKPDLNAAGTGIRHLSSGLSVRTADGAVLDCSGGIEIGMSDDGVDIEVSCLGIGYPLYEELFPDHVKAYDQKLY